MSNCAKNHGPSSEMGMLLKRAGVKTIAQTLQADGYAKNDQQANDLINCASPVRANPMWLRQMGI